MKAYVMCGAPGSGKSTHVESICQEHPDTVVVCGDSIREELYGDEQIQGHYPDIHRRMVEMIEDNVGSTIVMDGTHYRSSYRKDALSLLNSYGYDDVTLVILDKSLEICLKQNSQRKRNVPEFVIEKMHKSLQASLSHTKGEGFTQIQVVN